MTPITSIESPRFSIPRRSSSRTSIPRGRRTSGGALLATSPRTLGSSTSSSTCPSTASCGRSSARTHSGGVGPGVAGEFLNHPSPRELLRPNTPATIDAIRQQYDEQLIALGFKKPARRTIYFPADNPYYDVLLVSRHDRALELWNKTNPPPEDPQLSLVLDD
jgi:hypothetical protein